MCVTCEENLDMQWLDDMICVYFIRNIETCSDMIMLLFFYVCNLWGIPVMINIMVSFFGGALLMP